MSTIDVAPDTLAQVIGILDRYIPSHEVRVIGSRVSGRAKPGSDLDVVIMGDQPLDLGRLSRLRDELDESSLPFRVDLIEWATASPRFRDLIDSQAVTLKLAGK